MRWGSDDTFWVVVDATPESEMSDILFETTLRGLELQFKGGLTMVQKPTIFTDRRKAEIEAYGRLVAMRATQAIARSGAVSKLQNATRIEPLDGDGKNLFETDLPHEVK
jgi:hypothetical protein